MSHERKEGTWNNNKWLAGLFPLSPIGIENGERAGGAHCTQSPAARHQSESARRGAQRPAAACKHCVSHVAAAASVNSASVSAQCDSAGRESRALESSRAPTLKSHTARSATGGRASDRRSTAALRPPFPLMVRDAFTVRTKRGRQQFECAHWCVLYPYM